MNCAATIPSLGLPGQVMAAAQATAVIREQQKLAEHTYWMQLDCPDIASQILPGQFFMLRSPDRSDPLLGRPFALLDVYRDDHGQPRGIEFGYVTVGKFTNLLTTMTAGEELEIWGPLGNGFPVVNGGHLAIVAGGIGQTPFVAVIREALWKARYGQPQREWGERPRRLSFCYGARSEAHIAGINEWFYQAGVETHLATDNGSVGHHGYVTQLLQKLIASEDPPTMVYCCGPEPMMHAVQKIVSQANIPALLSLETPMACGFGACFSCVAPIRQDDGTWDYKRVCVEGPVFPADRVMFDA